MSQESCSVFPSASTWRIVQAGFAAGHANILEGRTMTMRSIRTMAALPLLLAACVTGPPGPPGNPITWPPTSGQCVRNNAIPFAYSLTVSIGNEMTRLFADPACSTPPTCALWNGFETRSFPTGNPATIIWDGPNNHSFTIVEQDQIGVTARNLAMANRPSGKRLYKITFAEGTLVSTGPGSPGRVFATAYYAICLSDVVDTHIPNQPQR
jgi:hypothetical protein